jgi:RNA-directed DNA polymerase
MSAVDESIVREYFEAIGWSGEPAALLVKLCTHNGQLPQGAPTSPRLSNLCNYAIDARLTALAESIDATYSRYADDITFSFAQDSRAAIAAAIQVTKRVVADYGYKLHLKQKLSIRRRHQRQAVTGLVVNDGVRLPRETRRRLRAIRHRLAAGKDATLTADQLAGWTALENMIAKQAGEGA